jgi:phospholipid/cholesterol/gamma-HCH transport system substrate-binding protein
MQKSVPSFGRIAAMVVFALSCFGLLLFLWLAFGGPIPLKPKGYRFQTTFDEATQLAKEADVRISGVPVGKVKTIEPDKASGRTVAIIEMESRYAPLPSDSKAILRQKTLLGETYVELTPGSKDAPPVPEEGTLKASQVSKTVELDEILRAFDPPTRRAFQSWMQDQAQAIDGYGRDVNDALGNLGPFAEDAAVLVDILNRQEGAVQRLISNTGVVFEALTERRGQLRSMIQNANRVFATTAARDRELQESFVALPTFADESRLTLARLAEFSRDTNPLVTQLRPAARELSPTLIDLGALAPDLKRLFIELNPLIDASRTGFPAAQRVLRDARPLLAQIDPAARQLVPILDFLGLYRSELTGFFANVTAATQARTPGSDVHYLRTTNPLNPENLAVHPRRIGSNRPNPYMKPRGFDDMLRGLTDPPRGVKVYEDRHCNRAVPGVGNQPLPLVGELPNVTVPPVQVPPVPLPQLPLPVPAPAPPVSTPPVSTPPLSSEQLQALVPNELLERINKFAFSNSPAGGPVPAPACEKQSPYTYAGETTQYPHVKAGTGR